jgi:hypothetical protein
MISGVVVADNTFTDRPGTAIYLGACRQADVTGNRIVAGPAADIRRSCGAIEIEGASGVNVSGNSVTDPRTDVVAGLVILPTTTSGEDGVRATANVWRLRPGAPGVLDRRAAGR